jgi:nitrate reductase gamma subunit
MVSASALVYFIIWLVVAGVIFWLLNWLIDYVGIPDPFRKVAKIVLAVIAVVIVINALLMLVGTPLFRFG